jgi:glyceraldehyde 3-phosphate dehydrogenase
MRVAINGLGRIGRQALRRIQQRGDLELVAVNDLAEPAVLAHLVRHDSVHGRAPFQVGHREDALILDGRPVPAFREEDPSRLPFGQLGAQVVLECTGRFTARAQAALHLRGQVSRVILSAPSPDADGVALPGLPPPAGAQVLSAACPTTHALALLVRVLDARFGVDHGLATAVESYANDQRILDLPHGDPRMARAADLSMIPAPSEAARCLERALPSFRDRFQVQAVRVPTPDVSILDLTAALGREATVDGIHQAFREAAAALPGLVEVLDEPLVSVDLRGGTASCVVDPFLTRILGPRLVKVFAWYDNEAAYAARLADLCAEGGRP